MRNSLFKLYIKEIIKNLIFMIISECFSAYYNYLIGDLITFLKSDADQELSDKIIIFSLFEITSN